MSWVAVGVTVGSAAAKGISKGVQKRKARKKAAKEKKRIEEQTAKEKASLKPQYENLARSQKDLANVYEGAAVIDPEAQYARNASERGTAGAIDKAMRAGASTGEIMNMVSGLTARGQLQGQQISAAAQDRRTEMQGMAKAQAIKAAQTGLAGEEAMVGADDKGFLKNKQAQQEIYLAAGEDAAYTNGIIDDVGAGVMMGAGGLGANTSAKSAGSSAGVSAGKAVSIVGNSAFKKKK